MGMVNITLGQINPVDEFGYHDTTHDDYSEYLDPEFMLSANLTVLARDELLTLREYWFHRWAFKDDDQINKLVLDTINQVLNARFSLLKSMQETVKILENLPPSSIVVSNPEIIKLIFTINETKQKTRRY